MNGFMITEGTNRGSWSTIEEHVCVEISVALFELCVYSCISEPISA